MKARHKDTGEIIQLAEEGIISSDGRHFCWYQVELLPEPIDEVQPSLPSNLDEAAEGQYPDFSNDITSKAAVDSMRNAFKAGAEWMAQQGYIEEGIARPDDCEIWVNLTGTDIKDGDKVIVQIRKKQ